MDRPAARHTPRDRARRKGRWSSPAPPPWPSPASGGGELSLHSLPSPLLRRVISALLIEQMYACFLDVQADAVAHRDAAHADVLRDERRAACQLRVYQRALAEALDESCLRSRYALPRQSDPH